MTQFLPKSWPNSAAKSAANLDRIGCKFLLKYILNMSMKSGTIKIKLINILLPGKPLFDQIRQILREWNLVRKLGILAPYHASNEVKSLPEVLQRIWNLSHPKIPSQVLGFRRYLAIKFLLMKLEPMKSSVSYGKRKLRSNFNSIRREIWNWNIL